MDVQQVNSRAIHEQHDMEQQIEGNDAPGIGPAGGANQDGGQVEKQATAVSSASYEETYPEGGWAAWIVVLGSFFALFSAMGLMNSIAIFQAYTLDHQLKGYSEGTVGWIFSIYTFLAFFGGVYFGPIFDMYGPRWLLVSGCVCITVAMVGMSFCTRKCVPSPKSVAATDKSCRTMAVYPLLWCPWRPWHILDFHTFHCCRRPLVQGPARFRYRRCQLCGWAWRHNLPANADRSL